MAGVEPTFQQYMIEASQVEAEMHNTREELIGLCKLIGREYIPEEADWDDLLYTIRRGILDMQTELKDLRERPTPYQEFGEEFSLTEWLKG